MKIKSIHIQKSGLFHNTFFKFEYHDKPITLILGNQGVGKSSFLRYCYQALSWFPARYKDTRSAGIVMPDQDVTQGYSKSSVDVQISIPPEIGSLPETAQSQELDTQTCDWQLYKSMQQDGSSYSKVETQKLEQLVKLYHHAIQTDPLQGSPLIAYYPSERFVHDINIMSKNNHAIFQIYNAYELTALPYTTFSRFFEWLREISDIENAQAAQLLERFIQQNEETVEENIPLLEAYHHMHAPSLVALQNTLHTVFPEITHLSIQYAPKLQLMVNYQGENIPFQQLSNSLRNWIALIGDIVRRLCLLNPTQLYPCLEGDGVLLIDQIDHQLDQEHCATILQRLHQAFPQLQIIATGNRTELLEQASEYQCVQLEDQQFQTIIHHSLHDQFNEIYEMMKKEEEYNVLDELKPIEITQSETIHAEDIFKQVIEHLSSSEQQHLIQLFSQHGLIPLPPHVHE